MTSPLPARMGKKLFARSEHQRWERQAASDARERALERRDVTRAFERATEDEQDAELDRSCREPSTLENWRD